MTTHLWLIRHGPTNLKGAIGWTDVPADLSNTARLESLRAQLPHAPVVSSDLSRAVTTADAIQKDRARLAHDADLREINFGDWEGRTFDDIETTDAPLARAYWSTPGDVAPPNGESWNSFSTRATAALKRQIAANDASDLIIVAHFGVIIAALQMAANMPAKSAMAFKIDNLSLTRLTHFSDSEAFAIQSVNETT